MLKKLYFCLCKISDLIQKPFEFLIAFLLYTGVLAVIFQVLYRYVLVQHFDFSFPYTEEYSRYALVWMTYLGAGIVLKEGTLISISFLHERLQGFSKYLMFFITRSLMLLFMYVIIRFGFAYLPIARMFRSPVLGISGIFLYMLPVLGCTLMLYETIVDIVGVICGEQKPFSHRTKKSS